jgi:hypothetical protein
MTCPFRLLKAMVGIPHFQTGTIHFDIFGREINPFGDHGDRSENRSPTQGFEGSSCWIPVCLHQQKLTLLGRTFTRWYPF